MKNGWGEAKNTPWLCLFFQDEILVADCTNFIVARATIDRSIILWQEWNLRLRTTLSTDDCVHFSWSTLTIASATGCLTAGSTAGWAASRLIHQAFLLVELLFSCCEYEVISALTAF